MFSRLAAFAVLALPIIAVATPAPRDTPATACCGSTETTSSASAAGILALLGIDASDVNGLIGLTCSPISVVGVGSGSECSGTTVSCSNGLFGGIGVGCIPVTA